MNWAYQSRWFYGGFERRPPQILPPEKDMEGMKLRIVELEDGKKVWFLPPLFGELPKELMEALIEVGARDITYLGTAGGLKTSSHVGDMLSPTKVLLADGSSRVLTQLTPVRNKTAEAAYIHVSTPNIETREWHAEVLARGADVTDVELGHVLDTFEKHKDVKKRVVLALSIKH
jgi:hypothetical protein